jgi:hypothetical protein
VESGRPPMVSRSPALANSTACVRCYRKAARGVPGHSLNATEVTSLNATKVRPADRSQAAKLTRAHGSVSGDHPGRLPRCIDEMSRAWARRWTATLTSPDITQGDRCESAAVNLPRLVVARTSQDLAPWRRANSIALLKD